MSFKELFNTLKNSQWVYILIILLVVILILIFNRVSKKKKLNKEIEDLQIKINNLKSHPFAVDIAKIDAIARVNGNIKSTASQAKQNFDTIQENIKKSVDMLQDAVECTDANNFKTAQESIDNIKPVLKETDTLTTKLDEVLTNILNQASMQRKRINELKNDFHDIKEKINTNPNDYTFSWEAIDRITKNISHQFSDFESIMEASRYEDAALQAEDISASITSLQEVIDKIPSEVVLAKTTIPNMLNQLNSNYLVILAKNAYLGHLEMESNIEGINSTLRTQLAKLKRCEVDGVEEKLNECSAKINELNEKLEEEKKAFNQMQVLQKACSDDLDNVQKILGDICGNQNESLSRFAMNDVKQSVAQLQNQYKKERKAFDTLMASYESNTIPATTLVISFEKMEGEIQTLLKDIQKNDETIATNKEKENRARDQVSKFIVVLNESKASIRLCRLPNISKKYDEDIANAEKYIEDINTQLNNDVVDIDALSASVEKAKKLILNLYTNVNNLIDTTKDIEEFIMITNKYRPYYSEVDSALYSAELAYRNGEYTKACKLTANALEVINPTLSKQLTDNINKKLASAREA